MTVFASIKARIRNLTSANGPKLLRDLASLATGQLTSMAISFAAFAYLARVLDTESYGAVEYAIAVAALAAILIECGAGTIGVRELGKTKENARQMAADIPVARMLLALLIVPLVGLSVLVTDLSAEAQVLVWLFALSLFAAPLKQDWLLQGFERMSQASFALPIRTLVFAVGVFLFVQTTSDVIIIGFVEIASVTAMSVFFLWAQHRWTVPFSFTGSIRKPLYFLREGAAVGLSNTLWAFMLYAPMIMLTSLVGGAGPAWLGAAQRLVISLVTLSYVYHFNLYPVITRTVQNDPAAWDRIIRASARLVAWAAIGFALGTTLLRDHIMVFIYGDNFSDAGAVLAVLIWVFPLRMLTGHTRWSLIAAGHQRFLLYAEVAGATVLVVVGAIAIPAFGAIGAALSLPAGILTSGVITQFAIHRLVAPLSLLRPAAFPVAAAIAAIGGAEAVADDIFVQLPLGLAIFGLAALFSVKQTLADLQTLGYAKSVQA